MGSVAVLEGWGGQAKSRPYAVGQGAELPCAHPAPWLWVALRQVLCLPCPVLPGLSTWQGEDQRNPGVHVPFVHLGVGEAWCGGWLKSCPCLFWENQEAGMVRGDGT